VSTRNGGIDVAAEGEPSLHLRPSGPTRFVVREGDAKGGWAEFFEDGRLLRYDTLLERVG